jgi:hypothetical protein
LSGTAQFIGAPVQFQIVGKFTGVESMLGTPKWLPDIVHPIGVNASSVVFFEACGFLENLS